jgi:hypothetical protein
MIKSTASRRLARNSRCEFLRPPNKKDKASHSTLRVGLLILDFGGESEVDEKKNHEARYAYLVVLVTQQIRSL